MNHEFVPDTGPQDPYCKCGLHLTHSDHSAFNPIAAGALDAVTDLHHRIESILSEAGSFAQCKGCFAPVYWINAKAGKKLAYNPDGTSHFGTCKRQHEFAAPKAGTLK